MEKDDGVEKRLKRIEDRLFPESFPWELLSEEIDQWPDEAAYIEISFRKRSGAFLKQIQTLSRRDLQ